MANNPEWRSLAAIGTLLVLQTMFDLAPEGPWNARSFTRGVLGLSGLICLYISWFRFTFKSKGIIPSIDLWEKPESSWKYVLVFGLICSFLVALISWTPLKTNVPETTGMILLLIGCLSILNAAYVWLVVSGPLKEHLEEE